MARFGLRTLEIVILLFRHLTWRTVMALSTTVLDARFSNKIIYNSDLDERPTVDITGGTGSVYYIEIVTGSIAATSYFKIFDSADIDLSSAQSPILILRMPASQTKMCIISSGMPYTTALSFAMVTGAGDTGEVGPSATCTARIVAS
jgi:hypothetical protein